MRTTVRARGGRGFSLIELMLAAVVIAILAVIAVPAYRGYVLRAHRTEGKDLLTRLAQAQERYYTAHNRYADDFATLGQPQTSPGSWYVARIAVVGSSQAYTLTAVPQGAQAADACADLTLDNTGVQGYSGSSGNGACW